MKRIFELKTSDIENLRKNDLVEIIKTSEGRTVMAETIVSYTPYVREVSNLELAASFGADMITLNTFNFNKPFIFGIDDSITLSSSLEKMMELIKESIEKNSKNKDYIKEVKKLTGRLIGVNLEPVPEGSTYEVGYRLNKENLASDIILQVHDELILNVKENELEVVKALVKEEMENVLKMAVTLEVDTNIGNTWYEAK